MYLKYLFVFGFIATMFYLIETKQDEPAMSIKDVVDKTKEAREVSLTVVDFMSAPDTTEIDLRMLGIKVPDDPTLGKKTEGDIATLDFKNLMRDENSLARSSIRQPYRKWPNNEIPYALSSQYGAYSRSIIAKAMNEYHSKTCVRFIARDPRRHRDYVYIHADDGCYSLVGRIGGRQPLSLDSGCIQVGTIVHELMHAVGFFHEQSRYDRDKFIEIAWPNVVSGADDQFEKYGVNVIDQLNEPYDYGSIMHYGPYAFSSNGRRTIMPRRAGAQNMGQRLAFSNVDLRKINKLYQCSMRSVPNTPAETIAASLKPTAPSLTGTVIRTIDESISPAFPEIDASLNLQCVDRNWRCAFWAMPQLGYCNLYAEIRLKICPQSCGSCAHRQNVGKFNPAGIALTTETGNGNEFETLLASINNGQWKCVDRSLICSEILDFNNACLMPLTRKICRRTCLMCSTNENIGESFEKDSNEHIVTAENVEEAVENFVKTPKNTKHFVSNGKITISGDDGKIISDLNFLRDRWDNDNFSLQRKNGVINGVLDEQNTALSIDSLSQKKQQRCVDFSSWQICQNVLRLEMCYVRGDCMRTCQRCKNL